jgi:hypothetical protein
MILLMFYLDHTGAGQSLGEKKNKKNKKNHNIIIY